MSRPAWIEQWFSSIVDDSLFNVQFTPLESSESWAFSRGAIRHVSGLFFSITGVTWASPGGETVSQPLIEQREIGTLGFLMRQNGGRNELLVQAKLEPGNVGIVQLAPTCQATASNAARVHGGSEPPFSDLFAPGRSRIIQESLQSEQGTRFLGKRNRNVISTVPHEIEPNATHRWMPVDELLGLLADECLVNTDARSVLVTSSWEELAGRSPFTRRGSDFASELRHSFIQPGTGKTLDAVRSGLMKSRTVVKSPEIADLVDLDGWKLDDEGISPEGGGPFAVRHINVTAKGREVPAWDQPIVSSSGRGKIDLVCGRIDGVLHFLFSPQIEAGLHNIVELGPSIVTEPGNGSDTERDIDARALRHAVIIAESTQSEEGGRFFQDLNDYRIIDAGDAFEAPSGFHWLTLAQIHQLLQEGGWFTNEARSALSLLLKWL